MLVKLGTDFRVTGLCSCEFCENQLNNCHTLLTSTNEFLPIKKVMSGVNTMKTHTGSSGTDPHILNLDTRRTWVVNFTLRLLYPQSRTPKYPLNMMLGAQQSWSAHSEEISLAVAVPVWPPEHPVNSLVTILVTLPQLLFFCPYFPYSLINLGEIPLRAACDDSRGEFSQKQCSGRHIVHFCQL